MQVLSRRVSLFYNDNIAANLVLIIMYDLNFFLDEEGEAIDKNHNTTLEEVVPEQREEDELEKDGLEGQNLFKCGNELGGLKCEFSGETVSDFRDHVAICEFSVDALYLTCVHCQKQFKHVATLGNLKIKIIFFNF